MSSNSFIYANTASIDDTTHMYYIQLAQNQGPFLQHSCILTIDLANPQQSSRQLLDASLFYPSMITPSLSHTSGVNYNCLLAYDQLHQNATCVDPSNGNTTRVVPLIPQIDYFADCWITTGETTNTTTTSLASGAVPGSGQGSLFTITNPSPNAYQLLTFDFGSGGRLVNQYKLPWRVRGVRYLPKFNPFK
jgi:hypothetical protein